MKCTLDYGSSPIPLDLEGLNATILEPRYPQALADERQSLLEAGL